MSKKSKSTYGTLYPSFQNFQATLSTLCSQGFRKRNRGFTLVELLVVILIIGILLAIALPTFLNQQSKAQDTSAKQALNTGYKVTLSDATTNGGQIKTAAEVVSDINSSEPELTAAAISDVQSAQTGVLGVLPNAGGGDVTLAELSQSGNVCSLQVQNHVLTGPTCQAADTGGGGGGGGGYVGPDLLESGSSGGTNYLFTGPATANTPSQIGTPSQNITLFFAQAGLGYGTDSGAGDLVAVNPSDGSVTTVTPGTDFCGGNGLLNIAPAGIGKVVGVCGWQGDTMIESNLDGSDQQTIATNQSFIAGVASNRSKIFYETQDNSGKNAELWSANLDGSNQSQVSGPGGNVFTFAVSASTVAFTDDNYQLNTVPISGGTVTQLTDGSENYLNPSFSPDGSQIAVSANVVWTNAHIEVIPTAGGSPTQVTSTGTTNGVSLWNVLWMQ